MKIHTPLETDDYEMMQIAIRKFERRRRRQARIFEIFKLMLAFLIITLTLFAIGLYKGWIVLL